MVVVVAMGRSVVVVGRVVVVVEMGRSVVVVGRVVVVVAMGRSVVVVGRVVVVVAMGRSVVVVVGRVVVVDAIVVEPIGVDVVVTSAAGRASDVAARGSVVTGLTAVVVGDGALPMVVDGAGTSLVEMESLCDFWLATTGETYELSVL